MPENPVQIRQRRLLDALDDHELDALALNPGSSLTYLTGLHFHLSERPVVVIFRLDGPPIIVLPELEAGKLSNVPFDVRTFAYGEDPTTWSRAFEAAAAESRLDYRRVGVESTGLRVLELRLLEEVAPRAAYLSADEAIAELRIVKDEREISILRRAVTVAEAALENTIVRIEPGMSERDLARELTLQLLRAGSEPELPFSPIVAFGPNSANPHAVASDRTLSEGDLVLIDWGAKVEGYGSDLTRVFSWGEADDTLKAIAEVVSEANRLAREAAAPGVPVSEVDRAARNAIRAAGYGEHFTHRTGHGLGMEGHEAPFVRDDNPRQLRPGMVFTVEPGIYLQGIGGVRIEDDVLVTGDGCESLSTLDRDIRDLAELVSSST